MRILLALLLTVILAGPLHAAEGTTKGNTGRVPVILDTDIGDDIDDTWALAAILGDARFDLKLIVTATDCTPDKTRLVAKILEAMGRTDVPIGTGVKQNDKKLNQARWLGDYDLKNYKGKVYEDGIKAMIDCINASPELVTLCVIGPETNIAEALQRDPGIARKARVSAMAGSIHLGHRGKQGRVPEYNVRRDVKASQVVFTAGWPIAIAPLDSCGRLSIGGERLARIEKSDAPRAKTVIDNYNQWANRDKYAKDVSSTLYDTMGAYLCVEKKFCKMETMKLVVDDKGCTVPDELNGRPVDVAIDFADREGLEQWIEDTLTKN